MSIKKLLLPGVLGLALMTSGITNAKSMDEANPKNQHYHKQFKKVSPEQLQQIKQIMQSHKPELKTLAKKAHALHNQLRSLYDLGNPAWTDIKPLVENINTTKGQIFLLREKVKFEVFQKTGIKLQQRRRMMKHKKTNK